MKTVVVYKSISGFTKKYAEWIAAELSADLFSLQKINLKQLYSYDTIIFGGPLHAVGINGLSIIKKNLSVLNDKNLIVFTTGASPTRETVHEEVKKMNFSDSDQKRIRLYYFRGGFNYSKLNLTNKVLMTLLRWQLSLKRKLTPDEKGMLAAYSTPMDFTKKEHLKELLEYVRSLK